MARRLAATGVAVPLIENFLSPFITLRRTHNPYFCKLFACLPGVVWCRLVSISTYGSGVKVSIKSSVGCDFGTGFNSGSSFGSRLEAKGFGLGSAR